MATLCLFGLFSLPAQAVVITVGGVDYDVVYFTNGVDVLQPSFDANFATLTDPASAPWFGVTPDGLGGTIDAEDFASAYLAQAPAGTFDVNTSFTDFLAFGYTAPFGGGVGSVDAYVVRSDNVVLQPTLDSTATYDNVVFAYTVPIPAAVPEIDGNALAKALFLLFTLYVWILVRRNRRAA